MFLKFEDQWIDFEIDLLRNLINVLDIQFQKLAEDIGKCPDPDSFGLFDLAEGMAGMGFVTCQWYLTTTYGWLKIDKPSALKLGPEHSSGLTIVEIINHAGNYWKHHEEWLASKREKDAERIIAAFTKLGIDCENGYALTSVLASVNRQEKYMQFVPLIPLLEEWAKEVLKAYAK